MAMGRTEQSCINCKPIGQSDFCACPHQSGFTCTPMFGKQTKPFP